MRLINLDYQLVVATWSMLFESHLSTNNNTSLNILAKMKFPFMNSSEEGKSLHPETQFLYLHKFFYGGATTFTAHLFHTMGLTRKGQSMPPVLHPSIKSEYILRDFGYGLHYKNISVKSLCHIYFPLSPLLRTTIFMPSRNCQIIKSERNQKWK